ncbi:heavy metal-associated isoprenylated plant protein 3-like [Actinidia eriantha]|uniref:heavy metal-associated isoprenylated plant protein 3-like n=1 Tax=Actinidia eriantha TaxID=165200 RepID=UPI00258C0E9C|nr:heavy metal-associated isoprenylated plant protein 3-like [Actinidia eriantha]
MGEKDAAKSGGAEKKADTVKKDDGAITVVLKLDMHCEGCATKIKRAVRNYKGVTEVKADIAGNKLTVTGKVDPAKIRTRVEEKTHKKVELLSPQPIIAAAGDGDKKSEEKSGKKSGNKKAEDKKPKPPVSTVVFKIPLHCEGCMHKIKRCISRIKDVNSVTIDEKKDWVTVKGAIDANELVPYLKEKLRRNVEVVLAKKEEGGGGDGEKNLKEKEGGGDKKEKEGADGEKEKQGGGDKKEKEKEGGGNEKEKEGGGDKKEKEGGGGEKKEKANGGDKKEKEGGSSEKKDSGELKVVITSSGGDGKKSEESKVEVAKMEYFGYAPYASDVMIPFHNQSYFDQGYGMPAYNQGYVNSEYNYGHPNQSYVVEYSRSLPPPPPPSYSNAPQMFSDENPNACSVM